MCVYRVHELWQELRTTYRMACTGDNQYSKTDHHKWSIHKRSFAFEFSNGSSSSMDDQNRLLLDNMPTVPEIFRHSSLPLTTSLLAGSPKTQTQTPRNKPLTLTITRSSAQISTAENLKSAIKTATYRRSASFMSPTTLSEVSEGHRMKAAPVELQSVKATELGGEASRAWDEKVAAMVSCDYMGVLSERLGYKAFEDYGLPKWSLFEFNPFLSDKQLGLEVNDPKS